MLGKSFWKVATSNLQRVLFYKMCSPVDRVTRDRCYDF
jgi:hypothetical protein